MTTDQFHRESARLNREAAIGHRRAGDELDLLALALDRAANVMETNREARCPDCEGTGRNTWHAVGNEMRPVQCEKCGGTGKATPVTSAESAGAGQAAG
jgi:RecJ-like exonuclease